MTAFVDPVWVLGVFLVTVRLGALFLMSPIWGVANVPPSFRVILLVALSATLATATGARAAALPTTEGALLAAVTTEAVIGAILAFGVFAAFAVFSLAGKVLDIQVGFGIGSVFDPVTHAQSPVLGTLLNLLAVTMFFAIDGHHALLRGIALSLQAIPPGAPLGALPMNAVMGQFGAMFTLSVVLAAPVMFGLLLVEIGLAVISRNMPQMNVFIVAIPAKIFVGLALLAASVSYLGPIVARVFASIFRYWEGVLVHG